MEEEVIDLVSSEPDVVEILSSPPRTPVKPAPKKTPPRVTPPVSKRAFMSSSPLFDHEMSPFAKRSKSEPQPPQPSLNSELNVRAGYSSTEINTDDVFDFTPPKKRVDEAAKPIEKHRTPVHTRTETRIDESIVKPIEKPIPQSIDEPIDRPTGQTIDLPAVKPVKSHSEGLIEHQIQQLVDPQMDPPAAAPPAHASNTEPITSAPKKRTKFKSPKKPQPAKPTKKSQPAPVMTRMKAGNCVRCVLYDPASKWLTPIEQTLEELGCEAKLRREPYVELPEGVELVLRTYGDFGDEWDDEQQTFLKSFGGGEEVDLHTAFVVISSAQFEAIAEMSFDARTDYFASVRACVGEDDTVVFFFPEFTQHYKKQLDKYNREMRKRVSTDDTAKLASLPPLVPPPSEESYTNVQTELEVFHEIRAVYPRKTQDAVELLANSAIEAGYKRYSNRLDEIKVPTGGSVRSKTTPNEVSIECLTKVPGLPPRIARKLIEEAGAIGRIKNYLGTNEAMRTSRLKHFGKGTWNDALMAVMEDFDPLTTLGA